MGKKKNVKNVTKNEENNVIVETVTVNETTNNTVENNNDVIPSQNIIEPVVNNTMEFSDLYYAKKCNEILMSYYNNLVRIIPTYDSEYGDALLKLNHLKSVDTKIMNKMEEEINNFDLC
jgi:hypothetical protein